MEVTLNRDEELLNGGLEIAGRDSDTRVSEASVHRLASAKYETLIPGVRRRESEIETMG